MLRNKKRYNEIYIRTNISEKKDKNYGTIIEELSNELNYEASKKATDKKIEKDNNHIYFYSEVDRESIYDLIVLINETELENIVTSIKLHIEEIPIYLHINSCGGSIFEALNIIDVIEACKVPVYTIIEGATASAGTLISVVGKKRFMRPNAYMLIHELRSTFWGKMSEIEDECKNLKDIMQRIKTIYTKHSAIPKKELNELLKHDLWLNIDKCIQYKLIDELWQK